MKTEKIPQVHLEELACHILNLDYDQIDADTDLIEEKMQEEFGVDLSGFRKIVGRLIPLIDIGETIPGHKFKGFADQKNKIWIVKSTMYET